MTHLITGFLNYCELLPSSLLESVKKNASDYKIVQVLSGYELIVDSSEQPRERPKEYTEQKKYYSGKKKSHTFKNQITVLPDGQDIVDVIAGEPGPKSDITLFRQGQKDFNTNRIWRKKIQPAVTSRSLLHNNKFQNTAGCIFQALPPFKNFKAIKVILESHRLKLLQKNRKKEN